MTAETAVTRIVPTRIEELKIEARARQMVNDTLPLFYSFNTTNVEKIKQMIARFAESIAVDAVEIERERCARVAHAMGIYMDNVDQEEWEAAGEGDYEVTDPYETGVAITDAIREGLTAEDIHQREQREQRDHTTSSVDAVEDSAHDNDK